MTPTKNKWQSESMVSGLRSLIFPKERFYFQIQIPSQKTGALVPRRLNENLFPSKRGGL